MVDVFTCDIVVHSLFAIHVRSLQTSCRRHLIGRLRFSKRDLRKINANITVKVILKTVWQIKKNVTLFKPFILDT